MYTLFMLTLFFCLNDNLKCVKMISTPYQIILISTFIKITYWKLLQNKTKKWKPKQNKTEFVCLVLWYFDKYYKWHMQS